MLIGTPETRYKSQQDGEQRYEGPEIPAVPTRIMQTLENVAHKKPRIDAEQSAQTDSCQPHGGIRHRGFKVPRGAEK